MGSFRYLKVCRIFAAYAACRYLNRLGTLNLMAPLFIAGSTLLRPGLGVPFCGTANYERLKEHETSILECEVISAAYVTLGWESRV
jgi:hypothetical protein